MALLIGSGAPGSMVCFTQSGIGTVRMYPPYQFNNCPMIFAALDMVKREINEFSPTEPTPQESR